MPVVFPPPQVLMSQDLPHPFGLTVFDGRVYWTDWDRKAIMSADSATGENRRVVLPGRDGLRNIHVFHRNRPSVPNACSSNNGGCSHLCLISPKPKGFVCACPTGTMLLNDTKTCSKERKYGKCLSECLTGQMWLFRSEICVMWLPLMLTLLMNKSTLPMPSGALFKAVISVGVT